ncbi:MAG: transporter, partial [Candidatus Korobacteraceae bacterium]
MPKAVAVALFLGLIFLVVPASAQYKGDHIPGFLGLDSGTQAPPGIYAGDLLWVYPTSTVKDNNGNQINQRGSLTSTLDGILLSWVSNYKVFGANYGATVVVPFIQNRLQLDSLNVNSGFAFTDMI